MTLLAIALTLAAAAAPASDTPAASAKRFVDGLYSASGPELPDDQIYAPDLARLIARAEVVANKKDDPDLVGNALCDCQDLEGLKARAAVVSATPVAASVRVVLTGGVDGTARFLLKLVRTPRGWRLADSIAEPGGSYAQNLKREIGGK